MLNLANRKSNSPWGSSYKEGLPSTAVNDTVEIDQNVRATITTGSIDVATGQWKGVTLSDEQFRIDATHEAVANGAVALSPQAQPDRINMTEYNDIFIAIKPSVSGDYGIRAVMGPDTNYFANLTPIVATTTLRGVIAAETTPAIVSLLNDGSESLSADAWNIFPIFNALAGQKNMQIQITNNSGSNSDIQFAYMRVV